MEGYYYTIVTRTKYNIMEYEMYVLSFRYTPE